MNTHNYRMFAILQSDEKHFSTSDNADVRCDIAS